MKEYYTFFYNGDKGCTNRFDDFETARLFARTKSDFFSTYVYVCDAETNIIIETLYPESM